MPNTNKTPASNYDVGVFKVNGYRALEYGFGIGIHKGELYQPYSIQRNYSKDRAIEVEVHTKPLSVDVTGGSVMYKIKSDKLFLIF